MKCVCGGGRVVQKVFTPLKGGGAKCFLPDKESVGKTRLVDRGQGGGVLCS